MAVAVTPIPEDRKRGKRLGRHVEHDERSRSFGAVTSPVPVGTIHHRRYGRPFDQGDLGSCTGNAAAGVLQTLPFWIKGRKINEKLAVQIYSTGTTLDGVSGEYPPEDTGSTGLGVAKALVQMGYIRGYTHAFGLQHFTEAMMLAPGIIGINWYDSFDKPDSNGVVRISPNAVVRGGHEIEVSGQIILPSITESFAECWQSWGPGWGHKGRFLIPMNDLDRLLHEDGDATFFTL